MTGVLLAACNPSRETDVPLADTRDVKIAQQANEIKRLQAERDAAQQTSMVLDKTVHDVEQQLNEILALDGRIENLKIDIEAGINVESSRDHVGRQLHTLHDALSKRKEMAANATTHLDDARKQLSAQQSDLRNSYLKRLDQLQKVLDKLVAENGRLLAERDEFERMYNEAVKDASDVRTAYEETQKALDDERVQREAAEGDASRVLIAVLPKADLKRRKLLAGPPWRRRADCSCASCLSTVDRRTAAPFHVDASPKRVKVYSKQPRDSYAIVTDGRGGATVEILKTSEFWEASPCVVIGY
jgi:flagellar biosynthesis chaperone FliJ